MHFQISFLPESHKKSDESQVHLHQDAAYRKPEKDMSSNSNSTSANEDGDQSNTIHLTRLMKLRRRRRQGRSMTNSSNSSSRNRLASLLDEALLISSPICLMNSNMDRSAHLNSTADS
jgi:hypothetical protein